MFSNNNNSMGDSLLLSHTEGSPDLLNGDNVMDVPLVSADGAPSMRQRRQFEPLEMDNSAAPPSSFGSAASSGDALQQHGGISQLMVPQASMQPNMDPEAQHQHHLQMPNGGGQPPENQPQNRQGDERRVSITEMKKQIGPKKHGILNGSHAIFVGVAIFCFFIFYRFFLDGNGSAGGSSGKGGGSSAAPIMPYSPGQGGGSGANSFADNLWSIRHEHYQNSFWLESTEDDYLKRTHASEKVMRGLTSYRPLDTTVQPFFDQMCGRYRFDHQVMPPVSIVIAPVYPNTPVGLLSMTVHSILARTPDTLLAEIVIVLERTTNLPVPEASDSTEGFAGEVNQLEKLTDKVRVLRCSGSSCGWQSRVASRMRGFKEATKGEVVIFMDPYLEVLSSTWMEHLVTPLVENPRTITVPVLHHMDMAQRNYNPSDNSASYFVNVNANLDMEYVSQSFDGKNTPSTWKPHDTPFMESWIFAVDRHEFTNLKDMDGGLYDTKADSIGLSLKYQMCHGRIVMVPCSRVGRVRSLASDHQWIDPDVPTEIAKELDVQELDSRRTFNGQPVKDELTTLAVRNFLRTAAVWMTQSERDQVYAKMFGTAPGDFPLGWKYYKLDWEDDDMDFNREELAQEQQRCHDFSWFDKHILMTYLGQHHPWFT